MRSSHTAGAVDVVFDDPNLIADAGLVPVVALAEQIDLPGLVTDHVTISGAANSAGANPAAKVMSLVAGMVTGTGRRWSLTLADRVLLVAVYYRTNLTYRQIALLFDVSKSAVDRIVDHLAPLLTLESGRRSFSPQTVLIVDGMLVPTYDRTITASSKNYRYSVNMQVVIDANTRLTTAVGAPTRATATTAEPGVTPASINTAPARV